MLERVKPFVPLLTLVLVAGGIAYIVSGGAGERLSYSDTDPGYNASYWEQELRTRQPKEVYASFRTQNQQAPQERQHFAAHVIGKLIAEKLHTEGISLCDASFGFGCYHGFFGQLIGAEGISTITELDAECVEAFGPLGTGCQHGIGHGLLEYVGYDRINEALELCDMTTKVAPLLGCSSGVFMEFHTRLGEATPEILPAGRQFDPANPYSPCTEVREDDQDACYYELGLWFEMEFHDDYQKMNQLCTALPDRARTHCFLGVGSNVAPLEHYSLESILAACATFGTQDELACRAGASWSFYADPTYRELADDACAYPDSKTQQECHALADLTRQGGFSNH